MDSLRLQVGQECTLGYVHVCGTAQVGQECTLGYVHVCGTAHVGQECTLGYVYVWGTAHVGQECTLGYVRTCVWYCTGWPGEHIRVMCLCCPCQFLLSPYALLQDF